MTKQCVIHVVYCLVFCHISELYAPFTYICILYMGEVNCMDSIRFKWKMAIFLSFDLFGKIEMKILYMKKCVCIFNSSHIYRIFPRNQKCLIYNMHAYEISIYVIWSEIFHFIHVRLKNWCWGGELYNVQHEHR